MDATQQHIFTQAVNAIAAQIGKPVLFGPDNKPMAPRMSNNFFSRDSAQKKGTMLNWLPKRLFSDSQVAAERLTITERSVDLAQNNPYAAGIVDTFATTVIGAGLRPFPIIDTEIVGMTKDQVRTLRWQMRAIYSEWEPWADAGGRMSFGGIQFLLQRCMIQYGEYLVLVIMKPDPLRPYALCFMVLNPLRLRTPSDKYTDGRILDGVEVDGNGAPVAYWIKKSTMGEKVKRSYLSDTSDNYLRIPARSGHRWKVFHNFIPRDPEQVRGISDFAPAMKFFRDLNDYLDAELVSNIVTAAFALFIEVGNAKDPLGIADSLSSFSQSESNSDGSTTTQKYEELTPGRIMYGNKGEVPHPVTASRPGVTFDPFTKVILNAIAQPFGIPYNALFKDVTNVNFAGFRSAMLDAWRTYTHRRQFLGDGFCHPARAMLLEEAWLRGNLDVSDYYRLAPHITRAEWRGAPKGDIEPVKAVQADDLAVKAKFKTRAAAIAERDGTGDIYTTFDQLAEEEELMREKKLPREGAVASPVSGGTNNEA